MDTKLGRFLEWLKLSKKRQNIIALILGVFLVVLSFLFILFTNIFSSTEIPQVVDSTVFFPDGKTQIQLESNDEYRLFIKQKRLVYIKQQMKPNYGEYILTFYDFYGNKIAQTDMIIGEMRFVFAETAGRILAGQIAVLTRQNKSYLYDLDGNLLNALIHDYDNKQTGITEDEKYFWFAANRMRPLNPGEPPPPFLPNWAHIPYNHIMIFDAYTGMFMEEYSTLESHFSFSINGKRYTILVSPPDIPG